jgi:hypothetical protein
MGMLLLDLPGHRVCRLEQFEGKTKDLMGG